MNRRSAKGKSISPALAIAGLVLSAAIVVPLLSSPALAVIGTPRTCYPNPRLGISCNEWELSPRFPGGKRCVKCVCKGPLAYRCRRG
jgi:hypothetical protein